MIDFISENNKKNLVLFVHGFTGGKETWLKNSEGKRIPDYLLEDKVVIENFDLAYFEYYTKFVDKIDKVHWLLSHLPCFKKKKFKKNLSIDDIKDILYSNIDINFTKYQNIVIIAHSMGGLISKSVILKLIEENRNKINLFISLAVPHNGSNLANIGKLILNNPNIQDLRPLSDIIDSVNRNWIGSQNRNFIPRTIYFQGKYDIVVPNSSSAGYDSREKGKEYDIVYTEDDHSSILQPENENSALIVSLKSELLNSLKKKDDQPISDKDLKNLVKKIGEKLELEIPSFNDLILSRDPIPVLSSHISSREETIKELLQGYKKNWIAIYGLYDTGKTQLAILIHHFLKLETFWISFKDVDRQIFIQKILGSFGAVDEPDLWSKINQLKVGQKKLIILDDLIEFGQNEKVDVFFNNFIRACIDDNILIISTSNHKIHNHIKSIHSDFICEKEVVLLNELETLEIIESYSKSNNFKFKNLIYIITKGYPVYTQVICRYLDDKDWIIEEDQLTNFFTGNLFTDLTTETVKKVVNKIQDEDTRNLLYRLNVVITNISDKEIRIVAGCSPNINNPHEKITSLIGSWVQQLTVSTYSISPLIKRLGTGNIPESTLLDMNFQLGKSILDKGSLSQIDVFNSILYLTKAEKLEDAGFVLMSFLQHILSKPEYFYKWNFDLLWFKTDLPNNMSLQLRLFIRTLHLLFESNREKEDNDQREYLRIDLEKLIENALIKKIDVYFPSIILSYSYLKEDGKKAMKYFTYYKNSYTYKNLPEELSSSVIENITQYNNTLTWSLLMDISDTNSLNEWFDNFERSSSTKDFDKEQVDIFSSKLYFNFISKEEEKELPNWKQLLNIFKDIFEKAHQLNLEILKAHSIKRQIQINSEKLDDIQESERIYKQYISLFKDNTALYLITDEMGRQFYYKGNKVRSLEYLYPIADIKLEEYNIVQIDTYSVLSKIYGESNKNLAQYYINNALSFAKDNIYVDELWYIKLIGETAISFYLNNKIEKSLIELSKGYELLLNSFENDDAYKNVQLRYGNIILYIIEHFTWEKIPEKSENRIAPYRGFFENNQNIADLYNDEKLLIVITMLVSFFEQINDKDMAHRWANRAFDLQKEINVKTIRMLFIGLMGYKILEDRYDDAINEQIKIFNSNQKYITENKTDLPKFLKNYSIDFAIIASTINPICFRLLSKVILNEIEIDEVYLKVNNLLLKFDEHIEDKQLIIEILFVLENYPTSDVESQTLINYLNKLDDNRFYQVRFLGYIIYSMGTKSKLAIEAHLVFKDIFKMFSGSINLYIIVPFFVEFWKRKINEEPAEFSGLRKLEENLDKVKSLKNKFQIQAIFALISESLNYKLSQNDERWLKDYYDEY